MKSKTAVLIPAFNPDRKLVDLVGELKKTFSFIVVVNDGSTSGTDVFPSVAALGAEVLTHEVNRGKGAALKTGLAESYQPSVTAYSLPEARL